MNDMRDLTYVSLQGAGAKWKKMEQAASNEGIDV